MAEVASPSPERTGLRHIPIQKLTSYSIPALIRLSVCLPFSGQLFNPLGKMTTQDNCLISKTLSLL
jgi:hypothetical protein